MKTVWSEKKEVTKGIANIRTMLVQIEKDYNDGDIDICEDLLKDISAEVAELKENFGFLKDRI